MSGFDVSLITREDIPRWYSLSWVPEHIAVRLSVHKQFVESAIVIREDLPIIQHFKKEYDLRQFAGDLRSGFGFDGAMIFEGRRGDLFQFLIPAPVISHLTDESCGECNGTGEREFGQGKCLDCNGSKKKKKVDWRPGYALSASLTLFSDLTEFPQIQTSCALPQLMTISTWTMKRNTGHGYGVGGRYSIPLVRWLADGAPKPIPEMVDAMMKVEEKMFEWIGLRGLGFRAVVDYNTGWLNTSCPGDACGLNPERHLWKVGERGYEFGSHNVDSPMQQFELVASLAALHDRVDRELFGSKTA